MKVNNNKLKIEQEKELKLIANQILELYETDKTLMLLLTGVMGAGKTHFTKFLGEQLDIKEKIKSPTYTIMHEYEISSGKGVTKSSEGEAGYSKFIHIDLWRLDDLKDFRSLQVDSLLKPGNIIAIEWANKFASYLDEITENKKIKVANINFKILQDKARLVTITRKNNS